MKTERIIFTLFTCFVIGRSTVQGQTYKEQFHELLVANDTIAEEQLLQKWEREKPGDAELYIAWFNFYIKKSRKATVTLGSEPKGKNAIELKGADSSNKDVTAFLNDEYYYDRQILDKGFDTINKAIEKYPDRLDLRFGKIHMYWEVKEYELFTLQIIDCIDYNAKIKNKWQWTDGQSFEGKEAFLNAIQNYVNDIYNTGDDNLLGYMKRISETVLKYYPDHVESLSNVAVAYMLGGQYDPAVNYLKKAEKLAPTDYIVLSNIAQAYKLKKDKKNAIHYYKLTEKYGDEYAKEYAKKQIEELEKNKQ